MLSHTRGVLVTLFCAACAFLTSQAAVYGVQPEKSGANTARAKSADTNTISTDHTVSVIEKKRPEQPAAHVIGPLDVLVVCSPDGLLEQPINGPYLVEPEGSLNLGPPYGRVKVAGMTGAQAQNAVQKWLAQWVRSPRVYLRHLGPARWRSGRAPLIPYKIAPNDILKIRAVGALPEHPIDGEYRVASDGTIFFGKTYGRATVKGLTLEQAEVAIDKELRETLREPNSMVTLTGWESREPVPLLPQPADLLAPQERPTDLSLPAYSKLAEPKISRQIGVTDRQREEVLRLMVECYAKALVRLAAELRNPPATPFAVWDDRQIVPPSAADVRAAEQERKAVRKRVEAILTPQQLHKLQDLSFPLLAKTIANCEIQKQLPDIYRRWEELDAEAGRQRAEEVRQRAEEVRQRAEAPGKASGRILALLTDQQKNALRNELWRSLHPETTPSAEVDRLVAQGLVWLVCRDDQLRSSILEPIPKSDVFSLTGSTLRKKLGLSVGQEKRRQSIETQLEATFKSYQKMQENLSPTEPDSTTQELEAQIKKARAEAEKSFLSLLTPRQIEIVKEVAMQKNAYRALFSPKVLEKIAATKQQQAEFARIKTDLIEQANRVGFKAGFDPEEKKLQVLTPAQRQRLRDFIDRKDW